MNASRPLRSARLPACLLSLLLLTACSIGGPKQSPQLFAPEPVLQTDASWPTVTWSLALAAPVVATSIHPNRISVSPTPGELQVYRGAQWARSPADMVETSILQTLEDSGKIAAVARQGSGMAADYRLLLDIRSFRSDYAGNPMPSARIEINAKLLHVSDQRLAGSHTFQQLQPAAGTDVAQVAAAFGQALGPVSHAIAGWALRTGQAHETQAHSR